MKFHKIVEFIEKKRIITTSELSKDLKISWNTAEKYLLELTLQNKIFRLKKDGVNLWVKKFPHAPPNLCHLSPSKVKLIKFIHAQKIVTTSELASFLKVSWNTAEKYLLELTLEDKITRIKKSGVNLWVIK